MPKQNVVDKNNESDVERIEAKVKWYNPEKGYGFLVPDDGSPDIFMHFSVLDMAGFRHVQEEDRVVCDIGPGKYGQQVLRVFQVKVGPRKHNVPPAFLSQQTPTIDNEDLEEIKGTLKWFNPIKGFGFVYPDDGGTDIFLHASLLHAAGYESLEPGCRVSVKAFNTDRGPEAVTLTVIRESAFKETS